MKDLVENPAVAPLMKLPPIHKEPSTDPSSRDEVRHIHESTMWYRHVHEGRGRPTDADPLGEKSNFGQSPQNIVLQLNVDGVVPFKSSATSYTPMQCMILNLPDKIRHRSPFMLIPAMVPGPKCANIVPYLKKLVDELQQLYDHGFRATDPTDNLTKRYKVKLLSTNCDLPAHSANNVQQPHGSTFGCFKCEMQVCHNLSRAVTIVMFCRAVF